MESATIIRNAGVAQKKPVEENLTELAFMEFLKEIQS